MSFLWNLDVNDDKSRCFIHINVNVQHIVVCRLVCVYTEAFNRLDEVRLKGLRIDMCNANGSMISSS